MIVIFFAEYVEYMEYVQYLDYLQYIIWRLNNYAIGPGVSRGKYKRLTYNALVGKPFRCASPSHCCLDSYLFSVIPAKAGIQ
jgi:hypothetical protein